MVHILIFNADGFAEQTGWVGPSDGLLSMDRNGNGVIDDGSELFGDETLLKNGQMAENGFQALADFDDNNDGKIDSQDSVWSQLRAWVDANTDGVSQADEMHSMSALDIASISLNSTTVNTTDAQGNTENRAGTFQETDGSTGVVAEYTFQSVPVNTIPLETLPVPDDIAALPYLPGSGTVYDLHQAMVRDSSGRLEALVTQFTAENDPNVRAELMDEILFEWTGSVNIDPSSRGDSIDARKLAVLEDFFGQEWKSMVAYQTNYSNPNPGASVVLNVAYNGLSQYIYGLLMSQTHFKDLFEMVNCTFDSDSQEITVDLDSLDSMLSSIQNTVASDPVAGQQLLSELDRIVSGASDFIMGLDNLDAASAENDSAGSASTAEKSLNSMSTLATSVLAATAGSESGTAVLGSSADGASSRGYSGSGTCPLPSRPDSDPTPLVRCDPLVLDVTGFGIETTSIDGSDTQYPTYFDYNGDGIAILTGWVSSTNGLLVMDRNGNGYIDNGSELFSEYTLLSNGQMAENGYEALADLDANHDGMIDASDPAFSQLGIWQDVDGDGITAEWELHSLSFYQITSINLPTSFPAVANTAQADAEGNFLQVTSTYTKADGTLGQVADYNFAVDTAYSVSEEWTSVSDTIAALPDLLGYGTLRSLQQSMAQDTSGQLKALVEQFVSATDVGLREALLQQILFKWTDSDSVDPNSRGPHIDARKLAVLESFYGQTFADENAGNPSYLYAATLNQTYQEIFEMQYAILMAQTHLEELYDNIEYTLDDENEEIIVDFTGVIPDIVAALDDDPEQGKELLSEFARTLRGGSSCSPACYLIFREHMLEIDPSLAWVFDTGGLDVYDQLGEGDGWYYPHMFGTYGSEVVKGSATEGDGYINSLSGDDVLYGTDRDEVLLNQDGDAILVAGGGNDRIWAGDGD